MKKEIKKRVLLVALIITLLCAIMMVPASVFWIQVPDVMTVILTVLSIALLVGCLLTGTVKSICGKVLVSAFTTLAILIAVLGQYCNPYWNSVYYKTHVSYCSKPMDAVLSPKEAVEDLEYAMHYLNKLHPMFYKEQPAEVMTRYYEVLTELDSAETVSVCELNRKIQYIFSVMGDGHTYVKAVMEEPHYMKDIYKFNQAGCKLVAINGTELDEILEQTKDLYSFEVESWQLGLLKQDLSSLERLQFVGISAEDGLEYTFEAADGTRESHTYYEEDFLNYEEYEKYNGFDETEDGSEEPFVQYIIDEESNVAILTLDSCTYNKEYIDTLKEMFAEVKKQQIGNVAVDLRNNGGGNSFVANEFIKYLDIDSYQTGSCIWRFGIFMIPLETPETINAKYEDLVFDGNVYVLTSVDSFSSSMLFAEYIKDNQLGTIIGEAPGNTPNGYGDIAVFKLPNSDMFMQISTKQFFRADKENPSDLVDPDMPCDRDEAMDVLYETIAGK